jgi:histone H2A
LNKLLGHVTIAQGGVLPNIHQSTLPRTFELSSFANIASRPSSQEDPQGWQGQPGAVERCLCCFRGFFVFFSGADWFFDTIMGLWDGHVMALRFLFFSSISWLYIMSADME